MKTLAILHTTPLTIAPLKELAQELIPGCVVYNLLDDSILPHLIKGTARDKVIYRVKTMVKMAESTGADLALSACSSIGQLVTGCTESVSIPVWRIDEKMAEQAVRVGKRIGVLATLTTTLEPTADLLRRKALEADRVVELVSVCAHSAYARLLAGDVPGHDQEVAHELLRLATDCDVVVLAQASMARVAQSLTDINPDQILTSPRLGMERVRKYFSV